VDGDENGEIDYEEFVSMMTKVVKSLEQKKEE
jgi:Ca2+-binding EF-hand superfamily protein